MDNPNGSVLEKSDDKEMTAIQETKQHHNKEM